MKKRITFGFAIVAALVTALTGCGGGGGGGSATPTVALSGTIIDVDSSPISGAVVEVNGSTVTTNSSGEFAVTIEYAAIPDRVLYTITKDGYFDFEGGVTPTANNEAMIMIALTEKTLMGTVDGAAGGTVSDEDLNIDIPAGALVDENGDQVDGDVNVYGAMISPDDPNFSNAMPGGDFQATDDSGDAGSLTSFGAMNLGLEDQSGDDVEIDDAVGIEVRLTIPASLQASAPDTIDVWIMTNGGWTTAGTATRDGNEYVFILTDDGAINCDLFGRNAIVEGTVYDFGTPVPNTEVTIGQLNTFTDSFGAYSALVPSNQDLTFEAEPYGSVFKENGSLSTTQVNQVDIGAPSAPELGEGQFTFQGTTYSGVAVYTGLTWGITDLATYATLSISGVPADGYATVEGDGVIAGFTPNLGGDLYAAVAGSVTRSGDNLSFSFDMEDPYTGGSAGTLSGTMNATDAGGF